MTAPPMTQAEFTSHALRRCAEMRVPVDTIRAILAAPTTTYPGHLTSLGSPTTLVVSEVDDRYTVCTTVDDQGKVLVVTILFNAPGPYERDGDGYILLDSGERVHCDPAPSIRPNPRAMDAIRRVALAASRRRIEVMPEAEDLGDVIAELRSRADALEELAGQGYGLASVAGQVVVEVRKG